MADNFSKATVRKLAERASYICSNPYCHRMTVGPEMSDQKKSKIGGEAAHICSAAKNQARYDANQTSRQRSGIANGIWLCVTCARLIDKNKGADFPVEDLKKWKKDHESLMTRGLRGEFTMSKSLSLLNEEKKICVKIMNFMDDRGFLFVPYHQEMPSFVIESLKETRSFLNSLLSEVDAGSVLERIIKNIISACRYYMNNTSVDPDFSEMNYGLGAVRKAVLVEMNLIETHFGVNVPEKFQDVIPS